MTLVRAAPARLVRDYDASVLSSLWQDPEMTTPVTTNAEVVGAWMDLSGNGGHAFQSSGTRKPTYRTNIQNGLPGVLFDGSDDFMRDLTLLLPPPFSLVVVHQLTSTLTQWLIGGAGNDSRVDFNVSNGGPGVYQWAATGAPFDLQTGNIAQVGVGRTFIGVGCWSRSSFLMGSTYLPQGSLGPTSYKGLTLGASHLEPPTLFARAYLCKVQLYAGTLTQSQIGVISADLTARWGTS